MTIRDHFATLLALVYMLRIEILVVIVLKLAFTIWPYVRPSSLQKYRRNYSTWALVTGSSHGIGLAFAEELLVCGFNVLIHGRNESKLGGIRLALLEKYPQRSIQILVADAAGSEVDYDAILRTIQALPGKLTVLINNVGGSPVVHSFAPLEEMPAENIDTIINLNARFQTHLTSRLLPILKANGPSAIVCCSSTAGLFGMPYIVTYGSSKSFVHGLCNSLRAELSSSAEGRNGIKIDVHGLLIGEVDTSDNGAAAQTSFGVLRPRELVVGALGKVGCWRTLVWANWKHALQYHVMQVFPERLIRSITAQVLRKKRDE